MVRTTNAVQSLVTMAEQQSDSIPAQTETGIMYFASLLSARMAESRRLRALSAAASPPKPGGLVRPFNLAGTNNELISLKNEVQMMANKLEEHSEAIKNMEKKRQEDSETIKNMEKKRAEDSETIKNLLQVVRNRLSDEGQGSNNEVKGSPYGHEPHSEEAEAGFPTTELGDFPNTEVEGSQHGHDQDTEESATEFTGTLQGATLPSYQVEASSSIASRHDKEPENMKSEIRGHGEIPRTQAEGLACNQHRYSTQTRKECSASSALALQPHAPSECPQMDLRRKRVIIESPASSDMRKRRGTAVDIESIRERCMKKLRSESSGGTQASDDTIVVEHPQTTPNSLPTSLPRQARGSTLAQSQDAGRRATRQKAAIQGVERARPTYKPISAAEKHSEALAKPAMDLRTRTKDKQARWLVSEQRLLIKLMNQERRCSKGQALSGGKIARVFNEKLDGVIQRRGEMIIGGGVLKHQRVAPTRTKGSITIMMHRCKNIAMKEGDSVEYSIEIEDDDEDSIEDGVENAYNDRYGDEQEDEDDNDDVKDEEE